MNELPILIADEDYNNGYVMSIALQVLGYDCRHASTTLEALQFLNCNKFYVLFLNQQLGDEYAVDVIPKCLAIAPDLRIIVLTTYSFVHTAVQIVANRSTDYLLKPFTPRQIQYVLDH